MDPSPLTAGALEALRAWFRTEARAYPWGETRDPYAVWISEIMLQQTVVTAAVAPYAAWMVRWPTVASLAAAAEDEVLRAWEGLGYASRARNLHRAARALVEGGRDNLPDTEAELRKLPGVGEYTASAILSFAFERPALTLDANLKRVFQRLGADPEWTPELERRWRGLWLSLIEGPTSRESNLAVMQLGQRICRPRSPLCSACPLAEGCQARQRNLTDRIPAPRERVSVAKATTVVFWHQEGGGLWWLARPQRGRFSNLWMAPPLTGPELPPGAQGLVPRVHTYTKYRDTLSPWAAAWEGPGDPPIPEGWMGRWGTPEQVSLWGMVSTYRRIYEEARASLG